MSEFRNEFERREVLKTAAGLAAGVIGLAGAGPLSANGSAAQPATTPAPAAAPATPATPAVAAKVPNGKPGEFDFLAGEWRIQHRRLKKAGTQDWDEFTGEATCWTILGGVGSVEELRIPARDFSGMGLRLLDLEKKVWNDFWVNGKSGVLAPPGLEGRFDDGVGTFLAEDVDGEQPIVVRGVWDRITPKSCRWHQAVSKDGGKTWEGNWYMDWKRA